MLDNHVCSLKYLSGKCFVYCNGLMDHLCVCENGNSKAWYKASGHFNGTLVKKITYLLTKPILLNYKGLELVVREVSYAVLTVCKEELCSPVVIFLHLLDSTLHLCRTPSSRSYVVKE